MVDKYIKSNICPLPWTHLEIDVNGGASPCCLYKGSVPGVKVYEQSLKAIQKNQYMEDLRSQFRSGARPSGCDRCWAEEDVGKDSKRINSLYKMKNSLKLLIHFFLNYIFEKYGKENAGIQNFH